MLLACHNYPLGKTRYCQQHQKNQKARIGERPDSKTTTEKRRSLGLGFDELTSNEGCRPKERIAVQTSRKKTCGLLYILRPCGLVLGNNC